jgi:hypothetical protein
LIQTMYGLQPPIDFVDVASRAATKYLSHYVKDFQIPLDENQIRGTDPPPLGDFVGTYVMDNLDIVCLDIAVDAKDTTRLLMTVNKQRDQIWEMWHYHYDVWCHLPKSYDDCLSRGLDRTLWSSFLISFTRDPTDVVKGLCWELDGVDVSFSRV